jgi:hypothetical protein
MAENRKKNVLIVKQQLELIEKIENVKLVTELAEGCGVGIE